MTEEQEEPIEFVGEAMLIHVEAQQRADLAIANIIGGKFDWAAANKNMLDKLHKILYRGFWYELQYHSVISFVKEAIEEGPIYVSFRDIIC